MNRYRFYCIKDGRKWYYTSCDYVALQGRAQPGIFTEADWEEWGNNGKNEREEIAEVRLAGAPMLPGMEG